MDSHLPYGTSDVCVEQAGQEGPVPCIPEAAAWHPLCLHTMTGGSSGWVWLVPVVILLTVTAAAIQGNCDTNCCALRGKKKKKKHP